MVARLWAQADKGGGASGDDALHDADLAGLEPSSRAALADWLAHNENRTGGDEGVWPQHMLAAKAFLAAATQWRTGFVSLPEGNFPRFLGLDYAAAAIAWQMLGINLSADDFGNFTVIENSACAFLNGAEAI